MKVDVLYAPGCTVCNAGLPALREAARAADPDVEWCELDIVQSVEYAVALGMLKAPGVAIDGELVFATLPSPDELASALRARHRLRDGH